MTVSDAIQSRMLIHAFLLASKHAWIGVDIYSAAKHVKGVKKQKCCRFKIV